MGEGAGGGDGVDGYDDRFIVLARVPRGRGLNGVVRLCGRRLCSARGLFVCMLLNVPAACECISGTDLFRQFYVLPH